MEIIVKMKHLNRNSTFESLRGSRDLKAHGPLPRVTQNIVIGAYSSESNLAFILRKIWGRCAFEEMLLLFLNICYIFRNGWNGWDVHN